MGSLREVPFSPSPCSIEVEAGGVSQVPPHLRLQLLPALGQHRHWLPAQRKSSHTPPQSSYLWNEHTEGRAPLDSTRCHGNELATEPRGALGAEGSCKETDPLRPGNLRHQGCVSWHMPAGMLVEQDSRGNRAAPTVMVAADDRGQTPPHQKPVFVDSKATEQTHGTDILRDHRTYNRTSIVHMTPPEASSKRKNPKDFTISNHTGPASYNMAGSGEQSRAGQRGGSDSPVDLALGPACMALSSWSMGWLERETIQISATLTEASLMPLQRLRTWPPSEGCCITCGTWFYIAGGLPPRRAPILMGRLGRKPEEPWGKADCLSGAVRAGLGI